ncbi:GNAT family N-acetyltransferase [Periweissella fabalis]|uniref:GNAT family N-acetyltransferase n=1 Tax=Periweissella fabalis TaxID=1070421 RepID=A0A7X6N1N5_9LACO|nr:GNAT family protein [Periweissella fabalis]MCM0599310.1 GNAT family N-acetyltransferase [Periweissella fabalis]NKZ23589.1 GNAT family N-acetyltransferase [Periweissella fabalis]
MTRAWFSIPITDDLKLVQPEIYMGQEVFNLVTENREHLNQFLPWVEQMIAKELEENFIRSMQMAHIQGTSQLFFIASGDDIIGAIDLHNINQSVRKADIGYWLSNKISGQGIMTTVVKFFCNYAFTVLTFNKLTLQIDVANTASNRVAEKCHFQFIGMHPADFNLHGELRDMNYYALLNPNNKHSS